MADRSRSRSPPRDDDNANAPPHNDAPPGGSDINGDAPPSDNGGQGGGGGGADEEVKLYVGNLDYGTDENRLRETFEEFGKVTDVFLPMDRNTQRPRGFGFVTMSTRPSAEAAIAKMDQQQLDGRTIRVNEGRPKGQGPPGGGGGRGGFGPGGRDGGFNAAGKEEVKLYVGNLSFHTDQETVQKFFEEYGEVKDCFLPTDRETNKVRGFAFVTMGAEDAQKACEATNGAELDGRTLRVNEAQPKGVRGGGF